MSRRDVLKKAAVGLAAVNLAAAFRGRACRAASEPEAKDEMANKPAELKKAVVFSMLPESLRIDDRLKLARSVGFDGVEVPPASDSEQIRSLRSAAEKAGVEIHSIISGGWQAPLSSPDPSVAERGKADLRAALKSAKELGADNVLLVPAVVDGKTRYIEAYERSQKHIRDVLPEAERLGVLITVENVWNNFLLSPLEFARYVDEFKSPYLQAYFDVGNVVAFGWPEDWVRTLGPRIRKVHLKDFKRGPRQFCNLRDGDVNWPEVRKALSEVGYKGYVTAELGGGNEAYLRDVSEQIDKIIAGE